MSECRVCKGADGRLLLTSGSAYFRCASCGTLQKELSAAEYEALDVTYDPGLCLSDSGQSAIEAALEVDDKLALLRRYATPAAGKRPRLLDVGCGMGGFLIAGQRLGYDVVGYEPSADHSRVARETFGLDVRQSYFRASEADGKFDTIVLSHVIEHILEPSEFIAELASCLAPDGRLIVVTPNAASDLALLTGRRWPMLAPADHVTMLTPAALTRLAPAGMRCGVATLEYPYEFAATIAAVARRMIAPTRPRSTTRDQGFSKPGSLLKRSGLRARLIKAILTLASLPFHGCAAARGKQACLVAVYRRTQLGSDDIIAASVVNAN